MKTKHTPGPWIDDGHDGEDTQIVNSKWGGVARIVYNGDCSQRVANAKLIAAAPELLEALKMAVAWRDEVPAPYRDFPFIKSAMQAIAKATL